MSNMIQGTAFMLVPNLEDALEFMTAVLGFAVEAAYTYSSQSSSYHS